MKAARTAEVVRSILVVQSLAAIVGGTWSVCTGDVAGAALFGLLLVAAELGGVGVTLRLAYDPESMGGKR